MISWVVEVVICSASASHFALVGEGSGQLGSNQQTSNPKTKKVNMQKQEFGNMENGRR